MALDKKLFKPVEAAAPTPSGTGNQEEGLILYLDANDVDSYDGDGSVWYDITNHEYTPDTDVSEHFNTVLYTGQSTAQTITASTIGFQPDLVWLKNRDGAYSHRIFDTVRGADKRILPDSTSEEKSPPTINSELSSFSDGFTLEPNNRGVSNSSADNYVAWCFKAGGAAVSNTDGDITSQVSVNNDLGFSIVTYTATGTSGDTFGHGLGVKPDMAIVKETSASGNNWHVYVNGVTTDTKDLRLSSSNGLTTVSAKRFVHADIDANVIALGNSGGTNTNNSEYVAYCFASKRGVSKVGSYTGSTGSVKVYTGFEPAFVMIKNTGTSGDPWVIFDNKRGDNGEYDYLYPSENYAEGAGDSTLNSGRTGITFNRDGFTLDDDDSHSVNESGKTHIYLAFAKNTKETSLHTTDLEQHLDPASYSGSGTTWTADTGGNATLNGSIPYDEELGDFFDLDGSNDYIDTNSVNGYVTQSHEIWVKADTIQRQYIVSNYPSGTIPQGASYFEMTSSGTIEVGVRNSSGSTSSLTSSTTLTSGKWYHLCATSDGSNLKFYINGELDKTTSATVNTVASNSQNLVIGYEPRNVRLYFNGQIGQFRAYSTALTQDQVRQNFNFTKNDYTNGFNASNVGAYGPSFSTDHFQFDRISYNNGDQMIFGSNIHNVLKNLNEYTFTAWYYPDNLSGRNTFFGVGHTTSNNVWALFRVRDNGNAEYSLNDSGTSKGATFVGASPSSTNDQWNFIAFTVSATGVATCRVNGTSYSPTYNSGSDVRKFSDVSFNSVTLGSFDRGTHGQFYDPFDGRIGQMKLYNKVLSNEEIDAIEALGR